ncbi:MAG: GNAT family N-acetyltransferase [Candidatus Eremiobacteraeota bacterium]|nr:GNAT family N-acetyltransferase [Candidatus Eremiobacteraeota bacterium]
MRRALAVRLRVFVEEQGVPLDDEVDAHDREDPHAVHALALDSTGRPIGAGRYYVPEAGTAQLGRMAVLREARGRGFGAAILKSLLADASRRGFARAHLHAQLAARKFYLKLGFWDDGSELWDAGILHQPMSINLFLPVTAESPRNS